MEDLGYNEKREKERIDNEVSPVFQRGCNSRRVGENANPPIDCAAVNPPPTPRHLNDMSNTSEFQTHISNSVGLVTILQNSSYSSCTCSNFFWILFLCSYAILYEQFVRQFVCHFWICALFGIFSHLFLFYVYKYYNNLYCYMNYLLTVYIIIKFFLIISHFNIFIASPKTVDHC